MVKNMATEKLDANNDLVKMLNSLGARAAAFTIRDKQVSTAGPQEGGLGCGGTHVLLASSHMAINHECVRDGAAGSSFVRFHAFS